MRNGFYCKCRKRWCCKECMVIKEDKINKCRGQGCSRIRRSPQITAGITWELQAILRPLKSCFPNSWASYEWLLCGSSAGNLTLSLTTHNSRDYWTFCFCFAVLTIAENTSCCLYEPLPYREFSCMALFVFFFLFLKVRVFRLLRHCWEGSASRYTLTLGWKHCVVWQSCDVWH